MKIVEDFECQVQTALGEVYEDMPDNFLKNLRKVVPFTKSKMIWNINSVKMNQNLKNLK